MKAGILGSGVVGRALANGFNKHGYEVMVGTRSPEKLSEWKAKAGKSARVGSFNALARDDDHAIANRLAAITVDLHAAD